MVATKINTEVQEVIQNLGLLEIAKVGHEYMKKGKVYYAKACFENIVQKDSNSIEGLMGIGKFHEAMKQYDKAATYYEKVCNIDPKHVRAKSRFSNMLMKSNQYNKARVSFNKLLQQKMQNKFIDRATIMQTFINTYSSKTYLEIGVYDCINFFQMDAPIKIAVDPFIRKPEGYKESNQELFFELESDTFFKNEEKRLQDSGLDVVLVDGLHTYEQSLNDVLNSLKYLNDGGLIVMHDCNPKNKASAHRNMKEAVKLPGFTGGWMGDVYKSILWLRANREDLEVCVLDVDCGLGMIKRGKNNTKLTLSDSDILNMPYEVFEKNKKNYLNMQHRSYWNEFIKI